MVMAKAILGAPVYSPPRVGNPGVGLIAPTHMTSKGLMQANPQYAMECLERVYHHLLHNRDQVKRLGSPLQGIYGGVPQATAMQAYSFHTTCPPVDLDELIDYLEVVLGYRDPRDTRLPTRPSLSIVVRHGDDIVFAGTDIEWQQEYFEDPTRETITAFCDDNEWLVEIEEIK